MFDGTIKVNSGGGAELPVSSYENESRGRLQADQGLNSLRALAPRDLPVQLNEVARWTAALVRQNLVLFSLSYAAALVAALTYIWTAAPWYSSSTFIYVDPRVSQSAADRQYDGDFAFAAGLVESQVQLIQSERTALAVIARLGLAATNVAPPQSWWTRLKTRFSPTAADDPKTAALRDLIRDLQSHLTVKRLAQTFVVEVTFLAHDAKGAQNVSQAFAQAYIDDSLKATKQTARLAGDWLRERLDGLRDQSRATDRAILEFRLKGDNSDPATLNDLESQSQVARLAYESFLRRFTDISQQESSPVTSARIASDASLPIRRGPGRLTLSLIAAVFAIGFAFSVTLIRRRHAQMRKETAP